MWWRRCCLGFYEDVNGVFVVVSVGVGAEVVVAVRIGFHLGKEGGLA